jgi:hypothetical protein
MSPRRIRWTIRLVLYGTLLVIGLALLAARPGEKVVLSGETSQREHFDVQARDDGEVDAFQTYLVTRCSRSKTVDITWTPADGDPVGFERDGEGIDVREEWEREEGGTVERGWATLEGRVAGDGRSASGTMTASITFSRDGDEVDRCSVRDVSFRAVAPR